MIVGLSPAAARRRLGVELRELRETAGKKIEDAAEALDCSTAKISRLENGKGVPFARDVRDLLDFYDPVPADKRDRLLELAADGRAQDWFSNFRDVLQGDMFADHLLRFVELERDAVEMKAFEADLIPGLLQTEEYVDAVCAIVAPDRSERERKRFVEFRRERRNRVLLQGQDKAPELSVILSELAIVRHLGGPDVMRRQLEAMLSDLEGRLDFVDFRITPLTREARGALGGPFCILKFADSSDQSVVYLEGREGANYLESNGDVMRYDQIFSGLERDSMTRADSLKRIEHEITLLS
jgi:transcriptional regulator with XRE-family HTH domain